MKSCRIILTFAAICLICAALAVSINAQDSTGINLDEIRAKADAGDDIAMREMGDLYLQGIKVEKDFAQAAQWYQKSAEKNNFYAMGNLATLYYEGAGVSKDYTLARKYALPAANDGYHQAQLIMAKVAAQVEAGTPDTVEFVKWAILAAGSGSWDALNLLLDYGNDIKWAHIEKGMQLADSFKVVHTQPIVEELPMEPFMTWSFNWDALGKASWAWRSYITAVHQVTGEGIPQDTSAGTAELMSLSILNFVPATVALAAFYYNEKFRPKDVAKAFEYTSLAAKQKNPEAQYQLGAMYFNGEGTAVDTVQAIDWIRTAAYNGQAKAEYDYAVILAKGIGGLTPDLVEAYAWLSISAELGNTQASTDLPTLEAAMTSEQKTKAQEKIATLRFMLGK